MKKWGTDVSTQQDIDEILFSAEFQSVSAINVMPLIYDEKNSRCNIMVFDFEKAYRMTRRILFIDKGEKFDKLSNSVIKEKGRSHPIYLFLDEHGNYIFEIRYGGASANALQRGFWTHTRNALPYFDSLTSGWIDYSLNQSLVQLFGLALNASRNAHEKVNKVLQEDINNLKVCHGIV